MKKNFVKFCKIVIIAVLVCSFAAASAGCVDNTLNTYEYGDSNTKFSEMEYSHPDTADFYKYCKNVLILKDNPLKALMTIDAVTGMINEMNHFVSMYVLANIQNTLNIYDEYYMNEMIGMDTEYAKMYGTYMSTLKELLNSRSAFVFKMLAQGDEEFTEAVRNYQIPGGEYDELVEKEIQLEMNYEVLKAKDYRAEFGSHSYTYEAIEEAYNNGWITRDERLKRLGKLYEGKNEVLGNLYIELVQTRKQMNLDDGYESMADYYYVNSYQRDFNSADAEAFCGYVKKYIAPIYKELYLKIREEQIYAKDIMKSTDKYTGANAINSISENIGKMNEKFKKVFDDMVKRELYDVEPSETKMDGSFTTYISGYEVPFLFSKPNNEINDYTAIVHEFGHFYEMYSQKDNSSKIDVLEIHSQGMEILYSFLYGDVFPEDVDGDLTTILLYSMMSSIISGCVYDEFQRYAYSEEELTLEELNQKYAQLIDEYNYCEPGQYFTLSWVDVSHSYSVPFYYISYAVSAAAALSFYKTGCEEGMEKAVAQYNDTVSYASRYGLKELCEEADLISPFEEEDMKNLGEFLAGAV